MESGNLYGDGNEKKDFLINYIALSASAGKIESLESAFKQNLAAFRLCEKIQDTISEIDKRQACLYRSTDLFYQSSSDPEAIEKLIENTLEDIDDLLMLRSNFLELHNEVVQRYFPETRPDYSKGNPQIYRQTLNDICSETRCSSPEIPTDYNGDASFLN
ncbi:MAG: hypothetical protein ACLFPQ_06090 [Candidatus Woesearchaeota archaeon]